MSRCSNLIERLDVYGLSKDLKDTVNMLRKKVEIVSRENALEPDEEDNMKQSIEFDKKVIKLASKFLKDYEKLEKAYDR